MNILGFGTFGKNESAPATDQYNDEIEEISEDLESQHVKEIMGISEFGKKAKSFDILVSAFEMSPLVFDEHFIVFYSNYRSKSKEPEQRLRNRVHWTIVHHRMSAKEMMMTRMMKTTMT